ncbi:unnamed protein product, partial [Iphiclides podalirius]
MVVLIGAFSMVNGKLSCKFDDGISLFLICSPGEDDYNLNRGFVSDNNETYSINLKACRISGVSNDCFHGLPSLVTLDISLNKIKTLPLGIFDDLIKLRYLNISHNLITDFPAGLLTRIPNLLELDLTGNNLKTLNPGAFNKISMLFLAKNAFQGNGMGPDVFQSSDINFMILANNNMEGAPDSLLRTLRELVYLNLEECSLTELPKFIAAQNLNTLTHLTLNGNKIREISDATVFRHLKELTVLNVAKNLIEKINDDAFASLKKLEVIDLSANRLSTIAENQFQNTPKLNFINLSHNLITKLPVNAFRGTKLSELHLSDNRITYLQDNFCLELKNSGAVLMEFYFDRNPWQCACLKQLLREVKSMNVKYDTTNYDGKRPVCVTTSLFVCRRQDDDNKLFIDMYDGV